MPEVGGYDEATAALTPEDQAEAAAEAIGAAPELGLYGYYTSGVTEIAVASTTGLAVSQAMTDVSVLALAASDDASGYAEATSWRASDLDPAAVAREAAEKAARTRGAGEIEPQTFRAVLEPYAISELLFYFAFTSLNSLALLEGRSYLSGRLGEKLFDESFTLRDDGLDAEIYPKAFDMEGVPKQPRAPRRGRRRPRRRLGPQARRSRPATATSRPATRWRPLRRPSGRSRSTSPCPAGAPARWTSSPSSSVTAST